MMGKQDRWDGFPQLYHPTRHYARGIKNIAAKTKNIEVLHYAHSQNRFSTHVF